MRNILAIVSGLFERDVGNVMAFIFSVASYALTSTNDIFRLKVYFGDTWANIIYFGIGFALYYVLVVIYELLFIHSKIKIVPIKEPYQEFFLEPIEGYNIFTGLDVVVPLDWEITDCYVTLDEAVRYFYEDGSFYRQKAELEYKLLRWKSPLATTKGCNINIGENSNKETISVGKIVGFTKTKNPIFDFCLCGSNSTHVASHEFGSYAITLTFHWSRNGIRRKKYYSGYIASNGKYITIGKKEDYKNDKYMKLMLEESQVYEKKKLKKK